MRIRHQMNALVTRETPMRRPTSMIVTDFAISHDGQSLALIVSTTGQGGVMSSKLFLSGTTAGSVPVAGPRAARDTARHCPEKNG